MTRSRRKFDPGCVYELCFRVRLDLPFVPTLFIKYLLKSIIARTQREFRVELCHMVWMGNHPHIIVVCWDANELKNFYMEIQKKCTEVIKRLIGAPELTLWSGSVYVSKLADLGKCINRIAYLYANPAEANLVDKIEHYPGLNTYRNFQNGFSNPRYQYKETMKWTRYSKVPVLPSAQLSQFQQISFVNALKKMADDEHDYVITPNAWLKAFNIMDPEEVREYNQAVLNRIREYEKAAHDRRQEEGRTVLRPSELINMKIMTPHIPKKKDRKVHIQAIDEELRKEEVLAYKKFCEKCAECYLQAKAGQKDVDWPLNAFIPWIPPRVIDFENEDDAPWVNGTGPII